MNRKETWVNADGLKVGFGPQIAANLNTGTQNVKGKIKQIQVEVDATRLNSVGTAQHDDNFYIPAGAAIINAHFTATETFDEAVEFGTADVAGDAINQNGLIETGSPAAGSVAVGGGAQVNSVVAENAYLVVTPTASAPTEGKGTLVVQYII